MNKLWLLSPLMLLGLKQATAQENYAMASQNAEQLGRVLGYDNASKALAESKIFAERVGGGFLPKNWEQTCSKEYSSILCSSLDEYFSLSELSAASRKIRVKLPRFDIKNLKDLQKADFQSMRSAAPDWSERQLTQYAEAASKTTGCPRNFSLVVARKAEMYFPKPKYSRISQELGNHGLECVDGTHPSAEFLFLRQGLLYYSRGKLDRAALLLENAVDAVARKERYRVYYWLARIYWEQKLKDKSEKYRKLLVDEYPLSWMTIQIRIRNGQDPLRGLQDKKSYKDDYFSGDTATDRRWAWLKLMLMHEKTDYPIKRYTEFLMKRMPQGVRPAFLQHQARVLEARNFYRLQILVLSWIASNQPAEVNFETLKLLYPMPYFSNIDLHTPNIDTALLMGLVRQESGFDTTARSSANAMGLFQVLPGTARTVKRGTTKKDLFDFQKNILIGSKYFYRLVKLNKGSVEQSLAGYNAGQSHVNRWVQRYSFAKDDQLFVDLIPFRETRDYIPSILRNAYWYHRLVPDLASELSVKKRQDDWYTSIRLKDLVLKSLAMERFPANNN